jgi:hypothetical protein
MDLNLLESKINEELVTIKEFFEDNLQELSEMTGNLAVTLQNVIPVNDAFIEVKYSWDSLPDNNNLYEQIINLSAKLNVINLYIQDLNLIELMNSLNTFIDHFLEFNNPWKVVDWRCFYKIENDSLFWFDNRKSLIKSLPISDENEWKKVLEPEVNARLRLQYQTTILKSTNNLALKTKSFMKAVNFSILLRKLQATASKSLLGNISDKWQELITKDNLNRIELAILAYIVRISIEILIRNAYPRIINPLSKRSLGHLFGKLQRNGLFNVERPIIERNLNQLNEAVHGKIELAKKDTITIKEEFKQILKNYGLKLSL